MSTAEHNKVVDVTAPATSNAGSNSNGNSPSAIKPYSCQLCAKRKVKCDKLTPSCSACQERNTDCIYQAPPPPRRRKRQLSGDVHERLAKYERILSMHGLLPRDDSDPSAPDQLPYRDSLQLLPLHSREVSRTGKLVAGDGKSRYIGSALWRILGEDEMQSMSDGEEDEEPAIAEGLGADPLTVAFLGYQQDVTQYYPTHSEAMFLWKTYCESIEPICKILHIPTTTELIERALKQVGSASKADECLLFAICHFAVYSMSEEECLQKFGWSRSPIVNKYHFATRQALVNASFLKTTEMTVLQALIIFLAPGRFTYDSNTYWILTGVAVRTAQRMGLHRDGEKMGLPPFDVQLRRRLFYQLIPLEGMSSQMCGSGMGMTPNSWDVLPPSNVNDDQIWPGMTEKPQEQSGATEMMFCLARACLGACLAKAGSLFQFQGKDEYTEKDYVEVDRIINDAESEVEAKYIRYCDIIDPVHFLTIGCARASIAALRLRTQTAKVRNNTATDAECKDMFALAQKLLETDAAIYTHPGLTKFMWHMKSFFLWGSWDALIFVLTSLRKPDQLSATDISTSWDRIEHVYNNRRDLLPPKQALHVAIGRLTLKAWAARTSKSNSNGINGTETTPAYITALSAHRKINPHNHIHRQDSSATTTDTGTDNPSPVGISPYNDSSNLFAGLSSDAGLALSGDFNHDVEEWKYWDQLIQNCQPQVNQQQNQTFSYMGVPKSADISGRRLV